MREYYLTVKCPSSVGVGAKNIFDSFKNENELKSLPLTKPYLVVGFKECNAYLRKQIKPQKKRNHELKSPQIQVNCKPIEPQSRPSPIQTIKYHLNLLSRKNILPTQSFANGSRIKYYSAIWKNNILKGEKIQPKNHSIYKVANQHRTKMERKRHMTQVHNKWEYTLRDQNIKEEARIRQSRFKVYDKGLVLKGMNKMEKQESWAKSLLSQPCS